MTNKLKILVVTAALIAVTRPDTPAIAKPLRVEAEGGQMTPLGTIVSEVKGMALYGEHGGLIGRIEKVLASRNGPVTAIVVKIGDGGLGLREQEVLLRFDQVHRDGARVATQLSKAQLRAQPPWDE